MIFIGADGKLDCAVVSNQIMAHKLTDNKFLSLAYTNVKMGDAQIDGGYDGCFHSRVASSWLSHAPFISLDAKRSVRRIDSSYSASTRNLSCCAVKMRGILRGPKYETAVNAGMQQSIDGDIISRLTIRTCDIR
jgi:hypothetical protein